MGDCLKTPGAGVGSGIDAAASGEWTVTRPSGGETINFLFRTIFCQLETREDKKSSGTFCYKIQASVIAINYAEGSF